MLFQSRYPEIDATPIAVIGEDGEVTDERSYIVKVDGSQALVDALTFERLYSRSGSPTPRKVRSRAPKKSNGKPSERNAVVTAPGSLTDKVLTALRKAPMTSKK